MESRTTLFNDLDKAKRKMVQACQNGSKKAWRRWGKEVYRLQLKLDLPTEKWMDEYFKPLVDIPTE
jgi:hypothetical protein